MSAVSNSGFLSGGLNSQQLMPASNGDALCLEQNSNIENPSKLVHGNFHCPANNGDSLQYDEHGYPVDNVEEESPVIDIIINNVVCTFSTRCYLNLKKIAMEGAHVEYKRENGMLNMKLRRPNTTATIWSSGKVTCTGATSEDQAKLAARRIARRLQKLGFNIRFSSFKIVNVLGTCSMPFGIKLNQFSEANRTHASYEPELHPGVTYQIKDPKATLKIFSTGSITVTAPSVVNVQLAIEHIYALVSQFKMEPKKVDEKIKMAENKFLRKNVYLNIDTDEEEMSDELDDDDEEDDGYYD
ncbi:TATA box-binding protein-like protein 1 [Biomphalaria pfeifferi]|uniref:TATA box-binding protein-like 1 n=1 Tax=Biomphalaria pfeifferi TaxID=112525 RepID=A0AAD8BDA0_BIOPF|nr:TATA box-binding protein-like protein 1 [Biomphalaria pfeifferi]